MSFLIASPTFNLDLSTLDNLFLKFYEFFFIIQKGKKKTQPIKTKMYFDVCIHDPGCGVGLILNHR